MTPATQSVGLVLGKKRKASALGMSDPLGAVELGDAYRCRASAVWSAATDRN